MKRKVTVTIDVDTEQLGDSYFQDHSGTDCNIFEIQIRKDSIQSDKNELPGVFTLAHECGHMIGEIFSLPVMTNDPRGHRSRMAVVGKDAGERVYQSELEAWTLAETILEFDRDKWRCLDAYAKSWRVKVKPILSYEVIR